MRGWRNAVQIAAACHGDAVDEHVVSWKEVDCSTAMKAAALAMRYLQLARR